MVKFNIVHSYKIPYVQSFEVKLSSVLHQYADSCYVWWGRQTCYPLSVLVVDGNQPRVFGVHVYNRNDKQSIRCFKENFIQYFFPPCMMNRTPNVVPQNITVYRMSRFRLPLLTCISLIDIFIAFFCWWINVYIVSRINIRTAYIFIISVLMNNNQLIYKQRELSAIK